MVESNTPSSSSETFEIGFIIANIVGVRYYSGTVKGREMVGLVREPRNHFDPNAIKVLNTRGHQVGHLDRLVAAILSPLIDEELIKIEGIVPKGDNNTNTTGFKIPCQVHVFARIEDFEQVHSAISLGGVCYISNSQPEFKLESEAAVAREVLEKEKRSLDEIFMLVEENVTNKGMAFEGIEPPKKVILTELFPHQKQGLGWLVHREISDELPPFWEEKDGGLYVNILTDCEMHARPEPLRGGIFADDMGLGKTLTLLSLIALDKCSETDRIDDFDEICDDEYEPASGKRKRKRKTTSSSLKLELDNAHLDSSSNGKSFNSLARKTTLIVFPPSVFSTWISHLEGHTRIGSFKVYMFYGDTKNRDAVELNKYDIVLTTYSTLASEVSRTNSPLRKFEWWRIILDEAHVIKNVKSNMSKAVTNLKASRRWAVTGTPIQNGTFDLFSLMVFLHFEPFSKKNYWYSLINRPLSRGEESGLLRLQAVMASISLRRTKEKTLIGLPSKSIETCLVELSQEERELYEDFEREARSIVGSFINARSVLCNYSAVLAMILRLRQICTNVALCPPDLVSFFSSENIADVSNNPDLLKKIVSTIQDGEDFDCPICISPPTEIVITCCAHIFCRDCILKTLKRTKPCCPLCRRSLTQSDLFTAPLPQETDKAEAMTSVMKSSSKVSALIKILSSTRDENPKIKSVVFSQFQKMLVLLEEPLKAAGFQTLRLDGTMNAKRRAQVIKEFGVESEVPKVLLASLKTSSAGINLTTASRVYLIEPWWNPAVEEQAMNRVHRIGQTQDVKIVRFIARNSIEERILELQEKKKTLAREAFRKKAAKDKEVSIDDLRTLMAM